MKHYIQVKSYYAGDNILSFFCSGSLQLLLCCICSEHVCTYIHNHTRKYKYTGSRTKLVLRHGSILSNVVIHHHHMPCQTAFLNLHRSWCLGFWMDQIHYIPLCRYLTAVKHADITWVMAVRFSRSSVVCDCCELLGFPPVKPPPTGLIQDVSVCFYQWWSCHTWCRQYVHITDSSVQFAITALRTHP